MDVGEICAICFREERPTSARVLIGVPDMTCQREGVSRDQRFFPFESCPCVFLGKDGSLFFRTIFRPCFANDPKQNNGWMVHAQGVTNKIKSQNYKGPVSRCFPLQRDDDQSTDTTA